MPIYEYHCDPCHRTFETLVRSSGDVPHCPTCGSVDVAKQFSVPAAAQVGGGGRSNALPVCSDVGPAPMGGCGGGGCQTGMCGF